MTARLSRTPLARSVEGALAEAPVDLAVRREGRSVDEARGFPKVRAQEGFRAMRVRLVDVDEDSEARNLALHRARREQLLVVDEGGQASGEHRPPERERHLTAAR